MDNVILKVNDLGLKSELEKLFSKVKNLVEKFNATKMENELYIQKISEYEKELSQIKLELSGKNSEILSRDREIAELKNRLLDERKNKISAEDKAQLKARIRELMARLDQHLEQKANNNF
ncbi:MAG: hypothetical protein N2510_03680 [Ignavibacteria bacterium]|nr:hypothetical protein [Ignavibacteria bacterium]